MRRATEGRTVDLTDLSRPASSELRITGGGEAHVDAPATLLRGDDHDALAPRRDVPFVDNAHVISVAAGDGVVPGDTINGDETVVARATEEAIAALPADQGVVAAATAKRVVTGSTVDTVVTAATADHVVAVGAGQRLGCARAGDRAVSREGHCRGPECERSHRETSEQSACQDLPHPCTSCPQVDPSLIYRGPSGERYTAAPPDDDRKRFSRRHRRGSDWCRSGARRPLSRPPAATAALPRPPRARVR